MKVALIVLAVVVAAVAANPYYSGYKAPSYAHSPYYKFDWAVKDDYHYNDYGQYEVRNGYHTKGNWWVKLPGYSHIKTDYVVDSHPVSYGYQSSYKGY